MQVHIFDVLIIALLATATAMGEAVPAAGEDADLATPRHASMRSWCQGNGRPPAASEGRNSIALRCDGDGYK